MKQGDLVRRINFPDYLKDDGVIRDLWKSTALVVRGVYEGTITHYSSATGKPSMTELKPCVDVVIDGTLVTKVPVEMLERITPGEKREEEEMERG
jgi:hypothetical protein